MCSELAGCGKVRPLGSDRKVTGQEGKPGSCPPANLQSPLGDAAERNCRAGQRLGADYDFAARMDYSLGKIEMIFEELLERWAILHKMLA